MSVIDRIQSIVVSILDRPGFTWQFEAVVKDADHVLVRMSVRQHDGDHTSKWEEMVARSEAPVRFHDPLDNLYAKGTLAWDVIGTVNIIRFRGKIVYESNYLIEFGDADGGSDRKDGLVVAVWS